MADQKVKVAKPAAPKPRPVKPTTPTPTPISVPKAHAHGPSCVRCNAALTDKNTVRQVCSTCDLALQEMHWNNEHMLFRRTVYIPTSPHDDGPSLDVLISLGYAEHLRKPPRPFLRPVQSRTYKGAEVRAM